MKFAVECLLGNCQDMIGQYVGQYKLLLDWWSLRAGQNDQRN